MQSYVNGLGLGASLIMAIGAQNAHVLRMGIKRQHVALTVAACIAIDVVLIALGVATDTNGWYYWTGLLMHVPEAGPPAPPPPSARMTGSQLGVTVDNKRRVTVSWSGENAARFYGIEP